MALKNVMAPIKITIPAGEIVSGAIKLGAATILKLFVIRYSGEISFLDSYDENGIDGTDVYATVQAPGSIAGDAYVVTAVQPVSNITSIPVDFGAFAGSYYVKLQLQEAQPGDIVIYIVPGIIIS